MPHLLSFRKGWQNEHLAKFILSKFSFVAEPSNVSDDFGTDFYCTLFKIKDKKFLLPQNSFAIQIKSKKDIKKKKNEIEMTEKANFLSNMEIPFFVGVVDRDELKIEIYSGESVDHFFAMYGGKPKKVIVELVNKRGESAKDLYEVKGNKHFLKFPKIMEIDAHFDHEKNSDALGELFSVCRLIQRNIFSRRNNEHILKYYGSDKTEKRCVYYGPGSAQHFRANFFDRLAEVYYNFKWMHEHNVKIDLKEFELFEATYSKLLKCREISEYRKEFPSVLNFSELKKSIKDKK